MNRLELIKQSAKKVKQRVSSKRYREALSDEDRKALKRKNSERVKAIFHRRRLGGLCEKCETPAVDIVYEFKGTRMVVRKASRCVKHWYSAHFRKDMENALSSHTTIHSAYPMATPGRQPSANHPDKQS